MSNFDRKRKANGDQNHANKKSHSDKRPALNGNTVPFQSPSFEAPSGQGGLPPLPPINDEYTELVFTHPSLAPLSNNNYDRLEFLGDAYLELISSQMIFERFPDLGAGGMSKLRESMVKNETLGQYTVLYGLDRRLKQYKRFQHESAQAWLKIKGDVFEAYIGAIALSTPDGYSIAKAWLTQLWGPKMDAVAAKPQASSKSKEELAKKILGTGVKISYEDERKPVIHYGQGLETYCVGAYLTGWGWEGQFLGSGKGSSRVAAGQEAAAAALNNHPLIDEIIAKRDAFYAQKKAGEAQQQQKVSDK
jgi:ribonuclease-3